MTESAPEPTSKAGDSPLTDPYAAAPAPTAPLARSASGCAIWPPLAIACLVGLCIVGTMHFMTPSKPPDSVVTVRPTNALLVAVRDLSRLETTELHVEKVIDLSDRQSRLFGLVEASDAILLVAAGDVTIGVDLGKLGEGDVSLDPQTGTARMRLPEPEILSSRLDEANTYVYTRKTDILARRNEALETKARQEALAAIEKAGRDADVLGRARRQAERQLTSLATQLGAKQVEVTWR